MKLKVTDMYVIVEPVQLRNADDSFYKILDGKIKTGKVISGIEEGLSVMFNSENCDEFYNDGSMQMVVPSDNIIAIIEE